MLMLCNYFKMRKTIIKIRSVGILRRNIINIFDFNVYIIHFNFFSFPKLNLTCQINVVYNCILYIISHDMHHNNIIK